MLTDTLGGDTLPNWVGGVMCKRLQRGRVRQLVRLLREISRDVHSAQEECQRGKARGQFLQYQCHVKAREPGQMRESDKYRVSVENWNIQMYLLLSTSLSDLVVSATKLRPKESSSIAKRRIYANTGLSSRQCEEAPFSWKRHGMCTNIIFCQTFSGVCL